MTLILLPASVLAQNEPLSLASGTPLVGNHCTVTAGIGLEETQPGTFTVDVPGTPVASYWYWTERARVDPYVGDPDFVLSHNNGADVTIAAGESFASLENGGGWQWHSYFYHDVALDYVETGVNTFDVSGIMGLGNFEAHGIAVTVIYENFDDCPYGEVRVRKGLDSFRGNYSASDGPEFGPDSELMCEEFPASTNDRDIDFSIIAGGVGDENKLNNLWYTTGTGTAPADPIVGAANATMIADPLGSLLGPEWDIYETEVAGTTVTIPAGETYVCIQIESPTDPSNPTSTMSALWAGGAMVIPLDPPAPILGSIGDTITCADTGEGLGGVVVTLTGLDGGPITTTTAADGTYLFAELPLGDYTITVDPSTITGTCTIPAVDPDGTLDNMSTVTLTETDPDNLDQDFAYSEPVVEPVLGSIGDTITCADTGEGLGGVVVTLTGLDGGPITTTTAADGTYLFAELPLGDYTITVDPSTITGTCTIPAVDPDGTLDNMSTVTLTETDPDNLDQDFAYSEPVVEPVLGSIGDTITCADTGEGLGGVVVTLTGLDGGPITTTTAADGTYLFAELPLGDYTITVDPSTITGTCTIPAVDPDGTLDNMSTVTLTETDPDNLDQDFAYSEPVVEPVLGSIGDTITCADTGEGLGGVVVTLTGLDGGPITTTTAADGTYLFDELPLGDYTITVDPASITGTCTIPAVDPDGTLDNMSMVALTETDPDNLDQDFAYSEPVVEPILGSIGDTITCADTGDGLEGVVVTLTGLDGGPITTTTAADGTYLFDELPLGDYTITVDPASITGTCTIPAVDPDGTLDNMSMVALTETDPDNLDQDFAYSEPVVEPILGSIGDTITCADTGDGLEGVVVTLTGLDGGPITTTTAADGTYLFDELPLGDYTITVDPASITGTCTIPAVDPDGTLDNMSMVALTETDPDNLDQDFAYSEPVVEPVLGSIGDTITCADTGEGLGGVVVTLTGLDGGPITTTTAADGTYLFDELPLGDYTITVDPASITGTCTIPAVDPDGTLDNMSMVALTETDPDNLDQDFAYSEPVVEPILGSIGDTITCADTGAGIEGVTVTLTGLVDGSLTTQTNANGIYTFSDLPAGDYVVTVDTASLPATCNTPSVDPDGTLDNMSTVSLGEGENNLDQDFEYDAPAAPLGSIGDQLWCDTNANDAFDVGEGIVNASVILVNNANVSITTMTNEQGVYLFESLSSGSYTVTVDTDSLPAECNNPSLDPDGGDDSSSTVELGEGENNQEQDFAFVPPPVVTAVASVGNFVWLDFNANGIQDASEISGVAGITVKLHDPATDAVLFQTTTNSSGLYLFVDLQPGDYYISYELPSSYQISPQNATTPEQDSNADPASGRTEVFTLAAGQSDLTLDQGVFTPTSLDVIAEPAMVDLIFLPLMQN